MSNNQCVDSVEQDYSKNGLLRSSGQHTGSEWLQRKLPARWGFWTPLAERCRREQPPAGTTAHNLQERDSVVRRAGGSEVCRGRGSRSDKK